ncbi:MAG: hypothetical protein AAGD86_08170 [Pseudomonadota bacterium]
MKQQINLYQAGVRHRRPAFSAAAMAASLALCAAVLSAGWLLAERRAGYLEAELASVQRQEAAAAARLDALTRTLEASRGDAAASDTLQDALEALRQRERLLQLIEGDALGARSGFSQPLRALASHRLKGLWLTRVHVVAPGPETTLEGRATEPELVPEFLLALADNDALRGQRFDAFRIEQDEDGSAVRFSMTSERPEAAAQGAAP